MYFINYFLINAGLNDPTEVPEDPCVPIIAHPDVRRMLLWMKAHMGGFRELLYFCAFCGDRIWALEVEAKEGEGEAFSIDSGTREFEVLIMGGGGLNGFRKALAILGISCPGVKKYNEFHRVQWLRHCHMFMWFQSFCIQSGMAWFLSVNNIFNELNDKYYGILFCLRIGS
jgi:hypothetical protein